MKKALILNRRCMKHPERGGAEIYTMELAKALIGLGLEVDWFSSRPSGLAGEEVIEGVRFIRRGNELTTHFYGFLYALKQKDSIIIDEFNGLGFFTFFMKNSFVLIHQLYDEFWTAELGVIGYPLRFLERLLLRFYRKRPALTVSASTQKDLIDLGFKDATIIFNGLEDDTRTAHARDKDKSLALTYLGRLKKTKNPEDAIKAFLRVREIVGDARIWIIGDGPLYKLLKHKYGNIEYIHFLGYLSKDERTEYLMRSHFLLVPSIREGWGQVVIQANAAGTPAIGYDVHGLRDSIQNNETGILVRDYQEMASEIVELWRNEDCYKEMCRKAILWAEGFSWEKTRKSFDAYFRARGIV
ncbi:MAG: glycosyltransferase family 4 protein [Thermodesulfovibrionales bacterium]